MTHIDLINRITNLYESTNPVFKSVLNILEKQEENNIIDHLSYRTFDFPTISIDVLAVPFIEAGYKEVKRYKYENKEITARHYAHLTDESAPLIYFSELSTYKFSKSLQAIVKKMANTIPINILCSEKIFFTPSPWENIQHSIYEQLKSESEYAAGIYVNGFMAHHIGIRINHFKKLDTLSKICAFLKENKFSCIPKKHAQQSHIIPMIEIVMLELRNKNKTFLDGVFDIPTPYPEFVKRNYMEDNKMFLEFLPNLSFQKPEPMSLEQINQLILEDN